MKPAENSQGADTINNCHDDQTKMVYLPVIQPRDNNEPRLFGGVHLFILCYFVLQYVIKLILI